MPAPKHGLRKDCLRRPENFWPRVRKTPHCWIWLGTYSKDNYGVAGGTNAHRVAWMLTYGNIPAGLVVCHTCDNRACCNPKNLFLGTIQDNTADRHRKGRSVRGSKAGRSKLTEADARRIRKTYAKGGSTHRSLAEVYGVDHTVIGDILRDESWTHV